MPTPLKRVTHESTLTLFGVTVPAVIVEPGETFVSLDGLLDVLSAADGREPARSGEVEKMPMKKLMLTLAALAMTATAADAGPLRNLACAVKARVQSRPHVRQAACDVRQVAHAVASVPGRIVESRPVRTAFGNVVQAFGGCPGGVCR